MAAEKPTIVFIPGAFHTPECFSDVISLLKTNGFPVIGLHLPTAGKLLSGTADDDAKFIQETTQKLADEEKDIVLVMHSYGGFPGTESAKGLMKKQREQDGRKGGIISLFYIAASLPVEGRYISDNLEGGVPEWVKLEDNVLLVPDISKDLFYHDVPEERAEKILASLVPHSAGIYATPSTFAAYKHGKATYLFCEQDKALPPSQQQLYLTSGGMEYFTVHNLNTSHSPFLSAPQRVSDLIAQAAVEA